MRIRPRTSGDAVAPLYGQIVTEADSAGMNASEHVAAREFLRAPDLSVQLTEAPINHHTVVTLPESIVHGGRLHPLGALDRLRDLVHLRSA